MRSSNTVLFTWPWLCLDSLLQDIDGMTRYMCVVLILKWSIMAVQFDLLGRVDHLDEAHRLVLEIPFEANTVIWRALLSDCKVHGGIALARIST